MPFMLPSIIWTKKVGDPMEPPSICGLCGAWVEQDRMWTHEQWHQSLVTRQMYPSDTQWADRPF